MKAAGLPHSEIPGSKPVDGSPELIAVFRVLHSLLMPRHPSCARIRLAEFARSRRFAIRLAPLPRSCSFLRLRLTKRETGAAFWNSCLMRNFSLYGGDRSPPISYMSCNSLSTSNCLLSKIDAIQKEDARENSKRSCMPFEALMDFGGFHHLSPKGDVSLERR